MRRIYLTISLLIFFIISGHAQHKDVKPLPIGSKAPDFDLPGIDGVNHTLHEYDSYDILVILFTCNHCPTAQAYEDKIIKIADEYGKKGVGFVAISPNDPNAITLNELGYTDLGDKLEDMVKRAEEKKFNFPYLYDGETQTTAIAYGPFATPHAFVFNKERILKYSGRIDDTENPYVEPETTDLTNALDALVAGKDPEVAQTKTFGCSIKWSWKNEWVKKLQEQWAAEPVTLNDIDLAGVAELMKNNGDKLRYINVWATWCGPCKIEFPELVDINRTYRDRDFEFISITIDKPNKKDKALEMLKKFEASNQNYLFTGKVYDLIETVDKDWQGSIPYSALIAPGGEIIYKIEGAIDPLNFRRQIIKYLGRYYADNK